MKILLVRLRLIGDVIFTTPVIRALRRQYPAAHITYVVESAAAPVVEHNPHLSELVSIPHERGWARMRQDFALGMTLRSRRFDVAIDMHGGPRSGWLTWASRAPIRVGYDVAGRSWMYTRLVHRPRGLRPRHSVENQWDLLAAVDAALPVGADRTRDRVEMPVDADAARSVAVRLNAANVPDAARVIVLHVSAGNPFRRWPQESFAELAAAVVSGHDNRWVVVTSGPSDRSAADHVIDDGRARAGGDGTRIVSGDGFSLAELRALCDRAALYIGGDSGPLHIASTSDVPIVGLYGPTLAERSAPWRPLEIATVAIDAGTLECRPCEQRVCVPGDYRCLTSLSASRVATAANQLLGASA